jgi:Raf kinase inhibitor-like YbhB/YbcL family protein
VIRESKEDSAIMAFAINSPAFKEGATVPREFTCDGDDAAPPLEVSDLPDGTRAFALIMDDPDAPNGTFTHWLAYDMPASAGTLDTKNAATLKNSFGRKGYGGPCPPPGHGVHRYNFTVYAVDVPSLGLKGDSRQDLEDALRTHTLATAKLMGRYERRR